ncbi:hypothetical protein [Natronohydrobacter thiooxidans]|uniref:hypothetical protein n=1 Tax=Natronohydrobacter thiooxidans TaxID=87172 RepID=UPI001114A3AF|nr:hypothetical protein [Natronohydrobacter thiooxidans]
MEATLSRSIGVSKGSNSALPQKVLVPELFEEARHLLGSEPTQAALKELLSILEENFLHKFASDVDRDHLFQCAHLVVARAGIMGFEALGSACSDLQHACATGAQFHSEFARARTAAFVTHDAIACLLKPKTT